MSENFPSREVLELIRGQARMEGKLDSFLKTQAEIADDVKALGGRVKKIEDQTTKQKGYIAGITAVVSSALIFFIPWAKQKLGL